jgi:hypothetical protein
VTSVYSPDTADAITIRELEDAQSNDGLGKIPIERSDTFTTLLPQALYSCLKFKDDIQCQVLANLCVYKMYDSEAASCKALIKLQADGTSTNTFYTQGWKSGVPWLYYTGNAMDIMKNSGRVTATMSLSVDQPTDNKVNVLNF